MANKMKIGKGLILALAGAFLLTGCDSVNALPTNYNDNVIVNKDDNSKVDVYNNIMGTLYDDLVSNKKDDVLNNFIEIITNDQFGKYSEIKALVTENDEAKMKSFIEKHMGAYAHENKVSDDKTEDEYLAEKYNTTVDAIRIKRLKAFFKDVEERINEAFYNEITSKTYNDDTGKFYERRLAMAHYADLYDVDMTKADWYEGYITPDLKKEDVSSFIHMDGRYDDYIERNLIKTIYKDKLVEQYLIENNYSTLGRAYGRKVNIIKLTRDEKYKELPNTLLNTYATKYILGNNDVNFETIANAWRGFRGIDKDGNVIELDANEKQLLKDCGLEEQTFGSYKYFPGTQFGQLIEKYQKIDQDNRFADEEAMSALSEFTGAYTYSKEKGLKIKLADLATKDYTTDGWYVKNGGLTDLPTSIRDRLFKINVSNDVDNLEKETEEHKYDSDKYVRNINGHYYLTPATSESAVNDPRNFVIYDSDNFYIVEVVEAVSTSKLDIDGKNSYVTKHNDDDVLFTERTARKLAETLGTKDSYVNKTYSSYIEKYSVAYHDSSIFDYFKEKFPELFED